uniref:Wobble nucleotide-excising tRNase n=1 Tax=Candidatus Kentrum sp. LPFa TaxID=2126335 RepID=A0A450WZ95_9GAMM|nr:MAG: Wobble nucleotide-excising tRNase [Candidatus Kentron sp. LPFa]
MIESITIKKVATYGEEPEKLSDLSQFNFLFGSNGTGKTTISSIIADERDYPECEVTWKNSAKLQPMVYNRDFIERNFNQSAELKGIFTLGEDQIDTLSGIETANKECDELTKKIEQWTKTLQGENAEGGKKAELKTLDLEFKENCWKKGKLKYADDKLKDAFKGYLTKEPFKNKLLEESSSNTESLLPLAELKKKAESIFGQTPTTEQSIPAIDATRLLAHESNPILGKRVIGKDDVDIAAMIKKLDNSDWVRAGRSFYNTNEGVCPFCQQETTKGFAQSLNEYFDEAFERDSKAINDLVTNYSTDAERLERQLAEIIATPGKFLDVEKLKTEKALLDPKVTVNKQRLAGKKKEASRAVGLESLGSVVAKIESLIDSVNAKVTEHNERVANLSQERNTLTAQVWKFVLEELETDTEKYKKDKAKLEKAIESLEKQIETAEKDKQGKEVEIRKLEGQITSIQPTIDGINGLLSSFGFQGFSLAKVASGDSYKLVRSDGSDAKATLSEGERGFVTFLYFYHLLKGSDSSSGITNDRVVVFDDPVSSLDSDILFVVGSLIKGLFEKVRAGTDHIKQIFVLTHNVRPLRDGIFSNS